MSAMTMWLLSSVVLGSDGGVGEQECPGYGTQKLFVVTGAAPPATSVEPSTSDFKVTLRLFATAVAELSTVAFLMSNTVEYASIFAGVNRPKPEANVNRTARSVWKLP